MRSGQDGAGQVTLDQIYPSGQPGNLNAGAPQCQHGRCTIDTVDATIGVGLGETQGHICRPATDIQDRTIYCQIGKARTEKIDELIMRDREVRMGVGEGLFGFIHQLGFGSTRQQHHSSPFSAKE